MCLHAGEVADLRRRKVNRDTCALPVGAMRVGGKYHRFRQAIRKPGVSQHTNASCQRILGFRWRSAARRGNVRMPCANLHAARLTAV